MRAAIEGTSKIGPRLAQQMAPALDGFAKLNATLVQQMAPALDGFAKLNASLVQQMAPALDGFAETWVATRARGLSAEGIASLDLHEGESPNSSTASDEELLRSLLLALILIQLLVALTLLVAVSDKTTDVLAVLAAVSGVTGVTGKDLYKVLRGKHEEDA